MSRLDDLKKLKAAASAKLTDEGLKSTLGKVAGDAVVGVSEVLQGAEAVAGRSGLTDQNGDLSKLRMARAALRPGQTARTLLDATADEVRARRGSPGEAPRSS